METTVTNGTVALSQFPEESIYLRLNTTGYRARQLMLVNPFATSNRYTVLYPENSSSTFNQCFSLDNQGAGFAPDRSWLLVRAHFDGDWRTVAGGYFGPTNRLCVDLQDQTEYRLVVQDNDDRRSLGGYVAEQAFGNQVIPLPVKGFQLSLDRGDTYRWEASASKTDSGGQIIFKFDSRETTAKNLDVRVYEQGNESNQLDAASVPGTIDQNSMSFNLTEDQTATRWVVAWNATVDGAPEHGQSIVSAELGGAGVDLGLSDEMQNVAIGGSVILVGGLFGAVSAPIGAVVLAGYGGLLFLLGLLDISSVALFAALGIAAVGFAASHFGGAR
ncbi:hypothetical protein A4G99_03800 [Haladaptatus sp. R4]|uniref:hypothetical protein n=1 Tax=Haladaptatus sp. R4 TaxID=1679489 RepID=UPI0007B46207|nr:hypothetical protein [Haladaptatus sp. R4]KZN25604.1 hypothetical protein A4G99_03800 [Haladaptatus sp. R4]